ncbi:MAG: DNA repair protein RadC [Spirochaetales bacterium]|nr:DNA repair protein RadC [Spirochaetales bacterium]
MFTYNGGTSGDIGCLPVKERPRERLIQNGPGVLSDHELLTVFVGSGSMHNGVAKIAAELLRVLDLPGSAPDPEGLLAIKGIGSAKAAQLCAAMEYARRRLCPAKKRIERPADVLPVVGHFQDRPAEHFLSLSLNGAHELIALRVVTIGLINRTIVHPREIFADPIQDRATSIIVCHNHPSGNLEPSAEDREVTNQLKQAGEILGIKLLDHIIFSSQGYFSFLESGEL